MLFLFVDTEEEPQNHKIGHYKELGALLQARMAAEVHAVTNQTSLNLK